MKIPSIDAEALLNTMRVQLAQRGSGPPQAQQIEAQTVRKLDTLEGADGSAKGAKVDVTA